MKVDVWPASFLETGSTLRQWLLDYHAPSTGIVVRTDNKESSAVRQASAWTHDQDRKAIDVDVQVPGHPRNDTHVDWHRL